MKILIINLSPRPQGTSNMLCHYFAERLTNTDGLAKEVNTVENLGLYQNLDQEDHIALAVRQADTIVMIGGCYVDSYPAETIHLLEVLSNTPDVLHGQSLYGFIQGGMPYVHTHESGLRLLRNFASQHDIVWKGGFVMGGGAALNGQPLEHVMGADKIVPAIHLFIERIAASANSEPELYQNANMKVPSFVAFLLSLFLCKMIRKKYKEMGVDYKQKTPYLLG